MLIGKPSIPLLITKTLPLYKTDRGVKCEVYTPGTSSSPGSLLTTLTLTHRSGGTYATHYTPPENHDILDLLFKVYTDTTYATLDNAYLPIPEQLYLAGLSGSGGGMNLGGYSSIKLTDKDKKEIADLVFDKIKPLVSDIKIPDIDLSNIENGIKKTDLSIIQLSNDIQNSFISKINKILDIFKLNSENNKTNKKEIIILINNLDKILNDNYRKSTEQINNIDQKLNYLNHQGVDKRVENTLDENKKYLEKLQNKSFQILLLELNKKFNSIEDMHKSNSIDLKTIKLLTSLLDKFINTQKK